LAGLASFHYTITSMFPKWPLFLGCFFLLWACEGSEGQNTTSPPSATLLQAACGTCHEVPQPSLLPKSTWESHVLPLMGAMLGHYEEAGNYSRDQLLGSSEERKALEAAGMFPTQPTISHEQWQQIQDWFIAQAPAVLPDTAQLEIDTLLPEFTPRRLDLALSPPSVTFADMGPNGELFLGDANSEGFYEFDQQGKLNRAAQVRESVVSMFEASDAYVLTLMGSFSPTDAASGMIMSLPKRANQSPQIMLEGLQRPVHTLLADFNGDGGTDFLVSEYGKWAGGLNIYYQKPMVGFAKLPLRKRPGATRTQAIDWDKDGDYDIIALMAQGEEGIFYYENIGREGFKQKKWIGFPPSYGSTYFQLFNFNGDSLPDLLYTCGDNADYAPIDKPYHGIRVFENMGQDSFAQKLFIPLKGAYKALPGDFNGDGILDFAAISFFPDFENGAKEGFVLLRGQKDGTYTASTFPEVAAGRWIVMDAGDADQDGDMDILLGSLAFEVPGDTTYVSNWVRGQLPGIFLENQTN